MSRHADHAERRVALPVKTILAVVVVVAVGAIVLKVIAGGGTRGNTTDSGSPDTSTAVPSPPADAPALGEYVESTVGSDGTVQVREWIRSTHPIPQLSVATVAPNGEAGSAQAADVMVYSQQTGKLLAKPGAVGGTPAKIALQAEPTAIYLSYRIENALVQASSTVAGRMLANVLAMDVVFAASGGEQVHLVKGPVPVMTMGCVRRSDTAAQTPRPCGGPAAGGAWRVVLKGIDRNDRLIAQLGTS